MRRELEPLLNLAKTVPPADLPEFLGALEQVRCVAFARLATPAAESRPDESLTIEQASKRLGVSPDYLYRHWQQFKFARQEGRKILFSSNGIDAYLKKAR